MEVRRFVVGLLAWNDTDSLDEYKRAFLAYYHSARRWEEVQIHAGALEEGDEGLYGLGIAWYIFLVKRSE